MNKMVLAMLGLFCFLGVQTQAQAQAKPAPKIIVQGQVGTIHYPFKEWRPTPTIGVNSIVFLPRGYSILLLASRDVERRSKMVYAVAVQKVLWSK